jgi:glucosamine--fructose-6-phosphate aminotransferase (isomerizing)
MADIHLYLQSGDEGEGKGKGKSKAAATKAAATKAAATKAKATDLGAPAVIASGCNKIKVIAKRFAHYTDFLFLGRLSLFPLALEGALKLKEISYIHAEGYPAAEMKHGPIALISEKCPSVFFAPKGEIFNKVVSSMQEIKARKGPVIAIITEGCELPAGLADEVITIPDCHEAVLPIVAAIPVQLLSYYIAVERGCDVDKPRNLAKSVTVE